MTFQIRDIRQVKPTSGRLYFLDANVWLHKLAESPPSRAQPYLDFFDRLLESSDGSEPVIVVTSLLLAEAFNAHIGAGFRLYQSQNPNTSIKNLKHDYRPTPHYKEQRNNFRYQFAAYRGYILVVADDIERTDVWEMLERIPHIADFNDFYYARFCRNNGYTIVTDDGDFKFEDVEILTANEKLLTLRTN